MSIDKRDILSVVFIVLVIVMICLVWYTKQEQLIQVNNLLSEERESHNETLQSLNQMSQELTKKTTELIQTYDTIGNLTIFLKNIEQQWNNTKIELDEFHKDFNNLSQELNDSRNNSLRNPSYQELVTFLDEDKTNENAYYDDMYGSNYYVCKHFSKDLLHNASLMGYRCAFVSMNLNYTFVLGNETYWIIYGHAIVCFNTTDYGIIFVEPQTDEKYYNLSYLKEFDGEVIVDLTIAW